MLNIKKIKNNIISSFIIFVNNFFNILKIRNLILN